MREFSTIAAAHLYKIAHFERRGSLSSTSRSAPPASSTPGRAYSRNRIAAHSLPYVLCIFWRNSHPARRRETRDELETGNGHNLDYRIADLVIRRAIRALPRGMTLDRRPRHARVPSRVLAYACFASCAFKSRIAIRNLSRTIVDKALIGDLT